MDGMRTAAVFALLAFAPALSATAPIDKEALHLEMTGLQAQIEALSKGSEERLALSARFDEISGLLGGDRPCAIGPVQVGSSAARAAPAAPTGCSPVLGTFENTTPVAIPGDVAVFTSTIVVNGAGAYLWDVDVTTFLRHTFPGDLDVTLMSPAGTVVTLTTDNAGTNDDVFNGTVWDDSANPGGQVPYTTNNGLVTDHAYVLGTLASPLAPEESLAAFVGEDPNGAWTLTISDDTAADGGSLDSWSLAVTTFAVAPIESASQAFDQTTPVTIPGGPEVVTSELAVSGLADPICKVVLRTNMEHTFPGDLDVTLMSPAGTIVTVTTDNAGTNDNVYAGTVWDDKANPGGQVPHVTNNGLVTDHVYALGTLASPLVVEESLGAFLGQDGNGNWTLTVSDDTAADGGNLVSWGLDFVTCTCALPEANLSVAVSDSPDPVTAGEQLTYTVTVGNGGPDTADNVVVDLVLPADVTLVSATPSAGSCTGTTCNIGSLAASASESVVVVVDVADSASGTILATATVTSSTDDPDTMNNSATASTTVNVVTGGGVPPVVATVPTMGWLPSVVLGLLMLLGGVFWRRR